MNITICGKTKKTIRNWEKQCFSCCHAKIVKLRDLLNTGEILDYGGIFLFNCPHIGRIFKLTGKNTHDDKPDFNTRLVPINLFVGFLSRVAENKLIWRELIPPQTGAQKSYIAHLPDDVLTKDLGFNIPRRKQPCLICAKQIFSLSPIMQEKF